MRAGGGLIHRLPIGDRLGAPAKTRPNAPTRVRGLKRTVLGARCGVPSRLWRVWPRSVVDLDTGGPVRADHAKYSGAKTMNVSNRNRAFRASRPQRQATTDKAKRSWGSTHHRPACGRVLCVIALVLVTASAWAQPGSVDASFNADDTPGKVIFGDALDHQIVLDMAVDSQGRIVVAYASLLGTVRGPFIFVDGLYIRRHLPSGALDLTFGVAGVVSAQLNWSFFGDDVALALGASDEIFVGFSSEETPPPIEVRGPTNIGFAVEKFSAAGIWERSNYVQFDLAPNASEQLSNMVRCGSSLILVGGAHNGTHLDAAVAKLSTESLDLDSGFSGDGKVTFGIDLGSDKSDLPSSAACFGSSIYIAGGAAQSNDAVSGFLALLDGDGNLVPTFDDDGVKLFSAPNIDWDSPARGVPLPSPETWFNDLLIDLNGLIWLAGDAKTPEGDYDAVLLVTDASGDEVTTIGTDGWNGFGTKTGATNEDDRFTHVLETSATQRTFVGISSGSSPLVARLLAPDGRLDSSFAGGGLTQLSTLGFADVYDAVHDAIGRLLIGGEGVSSAQSDGQFARLRNNEIFLDGFESGNTNAW